MPRIEPQSTVVVSLLPSTLKRRLMNDFSSRRKFKITKKVTWRLQCINSDYLHVLQYKYLFTLNKQHEKTNENIVHSSISFVLIYDNLNSKML